MLCGLGYGKYTKTMNEKDQNQELALFEQTEVRKSWHDEKWYFSIVDVVAILSQSSNPRRYWSDLKKKLLEEGYGEVYENIVQLKLVASDGKQRETDLADVEGTLRIIQSIPSPKAEPFKRWLAKVGRERIDEIADPERAINRAKDLYNKKGYTQDWIDKRMRGIAVRNTLTDEWKDRDIKGAEYGILTNEIYKGTFDEDYEALMNIKDLSKKNKDNLRDHMGDVELILTMLAEASSTEITQARNSHGVSEIKGDVQKGSQIAGNARKGIEAETGQKVVSDTSHKQLEE